MPNRPPRFTPLHQQSRRDALATWRRFQQLSPRSCPRPPDPTMPSGARLPAEGTVVPGLCRSRQDDPRDDGRSYPLGRRASRPRAPHAAPDRLDTGSISQLARLTVRMTSMSAMRPGPLSRIEPDEVLHCIAHGGRRYNDWLRRPDLLCGRARSTRRGLRPQAAPSTKWRQATAQWTSDPRSRRCCVHKSWDTRKWQHGRKTDCAGSVRPMTYNSHRPFLLCRIHPIAAGVLRCASVALLPAKLDVV